MRIRYDHFMKLGWKFLIPVSLAWFVLVAVLQGYRAFFSGSSRALLIILAVVFVVALLVFLLLPEEQDEPGPEGDGVTAPGEELDAFADGYPVPPLPGQQLPVSPRVRRAQRAESPARIDAAGPAALPVGVGAVDTAGFAAGGARATPDSGDIVQEGNDD